MSKSLENVPAAAAGASILGAYISEVVGEHDAAHALSYAAVTFVFLTCVAVFVNASRRS